MSILFPRGGMLWRRASFVLYCVACGLCVVGMGLALLSRGDSMQIVPV